MTTRLELPDGWADIYDPKKVPYGNRKPVTRAGARVARYYEELQEWAAAVKAQEAQDAHPEILGAVPKKSGRVTPKKAKPEEAKPEEAKPEEAKPEDAEPEEAEKPKAYLPSDEEMDLLEGLQEAAAVAMVAAWSWDYPVSNEGLQKLPSDAVRVLVDHCSEHSTALFINTDPTPDEASPTTP